MLKRCFFFDIKASSYGAAVYLIHNGNLFSSNSFFIRCTTSSDQAGSIYARVKDHEINRNCFERCYSQQMHTLFYIESYKQGSHFNTSAVSLCAPFPNGVYITCEFCGHSFSLNEYNVSNSQIGDRQIINCHSSKGITVQYHGTEVNNTGCCHITAAADSCQVGGLLAEDCNYVGNKRTASSYLQFAYLHQASLKLVGSVVAGNNHQKATGSYGTVEMDISGCHFCSNGFAAPLNCRSCIPTHNLNVPVFRHCFRSKNFSFPEGESLFPRKIPFLFSTFLFERL